ncbi:RDD family protein [Kitasatospora sp. GAS1066B]|uniref:RDD family protein n=1 Tax=Kitasatospora sp. GAS1066B TaxID=3156271 RepID=UPI003518FD9F
MRTLNFPEQGPTAGFPQPGPVAGLAAVAPRTGVFRRGFAWLVDFAVVLGLAMLLGVLTFHRIGAMLISVPGLAGQSVWQLIKSRGNYVGAGEGLGLSLWHSAISDVQQGFVALVLLTFLYQFATLALAGRTLGKALFGLRVHGAAPHGLRRGLHRRPAAIRGAVTTVADIGCFAAACCALAAGAFVLAAVLWAVALLVFWVNALPALAGERRSVADRLSGTRVGAVAVLQPAAAFAQQGLRQLADSDLGRNLRSRTGD